MKLGFRFFFLTTFLLCLSMTCQRSSALRGNDLHVPKYLVKTEEPAPAPDNAFICEKEQELHDLLEKYNKYYRFQGNVLVSWKGQIIYKGSYGYADQKTKEPLTENSDFQLASVSKQFTAMAIMILKKEGKLDFDDDVRKYIPDWPYEGMTIRHLLNHTSGLQNYMWLVEHKWEKERAPYNNEVISLLIKNQLPLNFTPGRYFSYCNTGYVVLAYIVERISGEFFADFVDERIFQPLGMVNTFVFSSSVPIKNHDKLMGYNRYWRGYREIPETVNDGCVGDKGVYSNILDLYKWDQALNTEQLIPQELLDEAFTKATLRNKRKVNYGFGFRIDDDKDFKTVYHHGLWNGFRTSIVRNLTNETSIILLNHTNSDAKHLLVREIQKIMMKDSGKESELELADTGKDDQDNAAL